LSSGLCAFKQELYCLSHISGPFSSTHPNFTSVFRKMLHVALGSSLLKIVGSLRLGK
jgi:hypothetical protein